MVGGKVIGTLGEQLASEHLEKQGHRIKDRNYSNKTGEIDIVSVYGRYIVFTEVKSRTSLVCGRPAESVNYRKIHKIRRVAEGYLQSKKIWDLQPRFDVVEILFKGEEAEINHIENAF